MQNEELPDSTAEQRTVREQFYMDTIDRCNAYNISWNAANPRAGIPATEAQKELNALNAPNRKAVKITNTVNDEVKTFICLTAAAKFLGTAHSSILLDLNKGNLYCSRNL